MATVHIRGEESLAYTPPGGIPTTHLLAVPLQDLEPVDPQPRHAWESADLSARNIVTIGDGAREVWATIRAENQPDELKALLRAALYEDVTVTYRRTSGGTAYPCKVIATEDGGVALKRDRDRRAMREYEVRIHLRATSGTFDGLL